VRLGVRIPIWVIPLALVAATGLALWLAGCATIIHGTGQEVAISSRPSGAKVTVDNMSYGQTPVVVSLARSNQHMVKIEMDGYQPFEMAIRKTVSGWVWGNIIFGGLIGLAVDAISGGMYNLTPDQVVAELAKGETGFRYEDNAIYITVVLRPDPGWQRIATLTTQ
jgi:hypothetical protein